MILSFFRSKLKNYIEISRNTNDNKEVKMEVEYSLRPIKVPIVYKPISYSSKVSDRLLSIIKKIETLRQTYNKYVDLRFDEPISTEVLSLFEKEYKVSFPEEYKEFVTTIGVNNGPGYKGIFGPYDKPEHLNIVFRNYEIISDQFKYENEVASRVIHNIFNNISDESCKDVSGCFIICDHDMGFYDMIVMNGEQRGMIWSYLDGHLVPKNIKTTSGYKQATFYDWIESWLKNLDVDKVVNWCDVE